MLLSGSTFVIALFGMLIVPTQIMRSLSVGAIIVGVVSVLGALTLLPAALGLSATASTPCAFRCWAGTSGSSEAAEGPRLAANHRQCADPSGAQPRAGRCPDAPRRHPLLGLHIGASGVSSLPDSLPPSRAMSRCSAISRRRARTQPRSSCGDGRGVRRPGQAAVAAGRGPALRPRRAHPVHKRAGDPAVGAGARRSASPALSRRSANCVHSPPRRPGGKRRRFPGRRRHRAERRLLRGGHEPHPGGARARPGTQLHRPDGGVPFDRRRADLDPAGTCCPSGRLRPSHARVRARRRSGRARL